MDGTSYDRIGDRNSLIYWGFCRRLFSITPTIEFPSKKRPAVEMVNCDSNEIGDRSELSSFGTGLRLYL